MQLVAFIDSERSGLSNGVIRVELLSLASISLAFLADDDTLCLDAWGKLRLILFADVYVLFSHR